MQKIKWKQLLINILIPLVLIAGGSAICTMKSMDLYEKLDTPPLSPPGWVFPVVWILLFTLMGISSYFVWESQSNHKLVAFAIYAVQLIINFIWSIIFFNEQEYWLSFMILITLILLILLNMYFFKKVSKISFLLLIPYLLWVIFAGYLNLFIAIMN